MTDLSSQKGDDFAREAETATPGIISEFSAFLRQNKKWWLLPIIVVLVMFGALLVLSSSVAAPFIYTLF